MLPFAVPTLGWAEMGRCISLLGSTGSIGRQTLDVAEKLGVGVCALTAGSNVDRMEAQCRDFRPKLAVMATPELASSWPSGWGTCRWESPVPAREGPAGCCLPWRGGYVDHRRGGYGGSGAHPWRPSKGESGLALPTRNPGMRRGSW